MTARVAAIALLALGAASQASAQTTAQTTLAPPPAASPPQSWQSGITLGAQFEGGITGNFDSPNNGLNFGQLFTDRSNQFVVNQALLTAQRPLDPKATDYDFGFKLQGLYGTDGRYTQALGEFNHVTDSRYQPALIEANVAVHLPWLGSGGVDAKIGQFATPLGFETIDPSASPFYSHSYIYNFGLPFTQTGVLTTTHATPWLDIYFGLDSGENTTFDRGHGDDNGAAAGTAGLGLNLLGGKLTVLALTHIGPENPSRTVPGAGSYNRYENDLITTYKATDKLTLTNELNLIRDNFAEATGLGVAQYAAYALTGTLTLNARAEVFRDDKGFFVAADPAGNSYVRSELGLPTQTISAGAATYSEFTLGATWKPAVPAPLGTLMVRPEIRYDQTLSNAKAFNDQTSRHAVTAATDIILGF